jgi:hypothetical protein
MSTYADVPKNLDLPEQMLICIGKLIVEWANCESVFYGVFYCLTGRSNGNADVLWHSVQSTKRRMAMISDLIRYETDFDPALATALQKCIENFRNPTGVRNYYCHSIYNGDENGIMARVENWHIADDDNEVIQSKTKLVSKDTINQICCTIDQCIEIAERTFKLVHQLRDALQLEHVTLPPLPNRYN